MSFIEFTAKKTKNLDKSTVSINKGEELSFLNAATLTISKGSALLNFFMILTEG